MPKSIFIFVVALISSTSGAYSQNVSKDYMALQNRIASGWNTWSYGSMLTQVLLPEGLTIKVNLRNAINGTPYDPNYFLEDITVDKSGLVRPIAHTFDGSYTELIINNWYANSIRVQSAAKGNDIVILVTPLKKSPNVPYYVELQSGMMWNREGMVARKGETIVATVNSKEFVIRSTKKSQETSQPYTSPYLAFFADTTIGFYTGSEKTLAEVKSLIEDAEHAYNTYSKKYGDLAEAFKGIESVLGWNTLYDADKNRVITPVTRGWNEAWQGFVLFEWDTYLAAYLFALDNKDLAYSAAIAVTKGCNKLGAVPFTQMPREKVADNSQPPIGSLICWMIYEKYHEKWFLEEVYSELLSWNRWWVEYRQNQGYLTWGAQWKGASAQDGAWESGLDNSPMYEDVKMETVGNRSLFNMADVGLNSLYVADCKYLAKIAKALGKSSDENELLGRAKKFTIVTQKLWNEKTGIYLNKYLDRPEVSPRLTPTLFYPMLAGISTERQAVRMMKDHYYNPKEFYGQHIIPSCARNDKSFNNDYWRGAIWGPMNFLVYLGLRDYDKKAATELATKSYELYLKAWEEHHYIFENINSDKGVDSVDDNHTNSDPYYHWGALMGIMKFMEDHKY